MEKVLILHGLDHDKMGKDAASPHSTTIETLNSQLSAEAEVLSVRLAFYQNNDSAQVCREITSAKANGFQGIVFNPAAWMDSGEEIAAALSQSGLPVAEVPLSNVCKAPDSHNVIAPAVTGLVTGFGESVYTAGLRLLVEFLRRQ